MRRRLIAFLTVGCTAFVLMSLLWPVSTKAYSSRSEIEFSLANRPNAADDFESLLKSVVARHTSPASIASLIQQNGLNAEMQMSADELAGRVRDRLTISLDRGQAETDALKVRVALEGRATPRENYLVNAMATTLARDFMVSPLAAIVPSSAADKDEILNLEQRRQEIYSKADALLAQIEGNLKQAASQVAGTVDGQSDEFEASFASMQLDAVDAELRDLITRRSQEIARTGDGSLTVSALDAQISDKRNELAKLTAGNLGDSKRSPFMTAGFTLNNDVSGRLESDTISLRESIGQLAEIAAEATTTAKASGFGPAFSIMGVRGRVPAPVNGVPGKRESLLLVLASTLIAGMVSLAYKPFAERGFESVENVENRLGIPVIATLDNSHRYEEATGPGIETETVEEEVPGANQIVKACQWVLFCGAMLIIGFCLANTNIRIAFLENPFYGFARIVWTLRGMG
jgi:hypothetical protein